MKDFKQTIKDLDTLAQLFEARTNLRKAIRMLDEADSIIATCNLSLEHTLKIQQKRHKALVMWQEIENEILRLTF